MTVLIHGHVGFELEKIRQRRCLKLETRRLWFLSPCPKLNSTDLAEAGGANGARDRNDAARVYLNLPPTARSHNLPSHSVASGMFAHSRQDSRQWKSSSSWAQRLFRREPVVLQLPAVHPRRNAPRLSKARMLLLATLAVVSIAVTAILKTGYEWTRAIPFVSTGPLVDYTPEQLRELWQWEVNAGHFPSRRPGACGGRVCAP